MRKSRSSLLHDSTCTLRSGTGGAAIALLYEYQFTSGALAGAFTAQLDEDISFYRTYTITAPTGFGTTVWSSANFREVHANDGPPVFSSLNLHLVRPSPTDESPSASFLLNVHGPFDINGTYLFETRLRTGNLFITGTGEWARVPEPSTLWLFSFGLLALAGARRLSHKEAS
jgi:hypothetical protein